MHPVLDSSRPQKAGSAKAKKDVTNPKSLPGTQQKKRPRAPLYRQVTKTGQGNLHYLNIWSTFAVICKMYYVK